MSVFRGALVALCLLAACTPAADFVDGSVIRPDPGAGDYTDELECRVGIIGAHCDQGGVCEQGLRCDYDGYGKARVCTLPCEDNNDCPWATQCMQVFPNPDGGVPLKRCVRPCKDDSHCSCAGSRCVGLDAGGSICK